MHQCMCSPGQSTLIKAIKRRHLKRSTTRNGKWSKKLPDTITRNYERAHETIKEKSTDHQPQAQKEQNPRHKTNTNYIEE